MLSGSPAGHCHHPDQQAQVPQGSWQTHAEGGDPRGGAQRGRGRDRPRRAGAEAGPDPVVPRPKSDPDPGTGGSQGWPQGWPHAQPGSRCWRCVHSMPPPRARVQTCAHCHQPFVQPRSSHALSQQPSQECSTSPSWPARDQTGTSRDLLLRAGEGVTLKAEVREGH